MRDQRKGTLARAPQAGVTLIELMVALGIAAVVLAVTMPSISGWAKNHRAKATARSVGDLLLMARAQAMRTGSRHVVFFGNPGVTDPSGNAVAMGAAWVPVLLIDDGAPATANCAIDGGEALEAIKPEDGISWGVNFATSGVATDEGAAPFNPGGTWDGATFADPSDAKINWVLFGPDGVPVTFVGAVGSCGLLGTLGSASGALYLTNGERDYAVVLSPLGSARVHVWNRASGAWSS